MKKLLFILSFCTLVGCALLSGCAKSKPSATQPAGNADANPAAASVQPPQLKIKWPVGNKYSFRVELTQVSETKMPNRPEPVKQTVRFTENFNLTALKELDDGGRQLELEFEDSTMNVNVNGRQALNFDSTQNPASEANDPVAQMLRKMAGARVRYLTGANGGVVKIEGVDDLKKRLGENARPAAKAMFQRLFSDDILREYGSFAEILPGKPVAAGDSWSLKRPEVSPIGVVNVDVKFTFQGWEPHDGQNCAHLTGAGRISSQHDATSPPGAFEIKRGETSGDIWFDPALAMIAASSSDQDLTVKSVVRGQTLETKLTQKLHLLLLDTTPKP